MNFNSRARAKARRGIESKRRREEKRARVLCARVYYSTESFSLSLSLILLFVQKKFCCCCCCCFCVTRVMRRALLPRLRIANKLGGRGHSCRCLDVSRKEVYCTRVVVIIRRFGVARSFCVRARLVSERRQKRKTQRA